MLDMVGGVILCCIDTGLMSQFHRCIVCMQSDSLIYGD